jgi:hypothetical protein
MSFTAFLVDLLKNRQLNQATLFELALPSEFAGAYRRNLDAVGEFI